uniref:Secreted protein n=1 Tax=Aegilops tauschii subsp. strangulata TaxID=200361 RepID=A0A453E0G7_AEGTS
MLWSSRMSISLWTVATAPRMAGPPLLSLLPAHLLPRPKERRRRHNKLGHHVVSVARAPPPPAWSRWGGGGRRRHACEEHQREWILKLKSTIP